MRAAAEQPLKRSIFHRLSSVLWGAIVILIVLLAVYVSVGRLLSSLTGSYQRDILQELNHRLPFHVDARQVGAEWHSFTPVLVLGDLQLTLPGDTEYSTALIEGRIALDVAGSLRTRSPQVARLILKGLRLAGELGADGKLRLRGFETGDSELGGWLEAFLLNVEQVSVVESQLALALPGGEQRSFGLNLTLARDGSRRRLEGALVSSGGLQVSVLGAGVGDPFESGAFSGQLYLDLEAANVETVTDLLREPLGSLGVRVGGQLGLELWSSWDYGSRPQLALRLAMARGEFAATDDSWRVPFDRLALAAGLEEREDALVANVSGLEMTRDDTDLDIPRVQFELRGETLDLRALSVPLSPLSVLLADTRLLPAIADELAVSLNPRGVLTALQLGVTDISAPAADWEVRASFRELATHPWQGAPGVSGASGYARATPGEAVALLDSQQFSLDFPMVYDQPLRYDDFLAALQVAWDPQLVTISSGLVKARGEEGEVNALFGLSIPLDDSAAGPDMDLLVGLGDTSADYRGKYIPHVLDANLRAWLEQSIGSGMIESGGFLWRGSLGAEAPVPHTVQLFFTVRDASLAYDPEWPAVEGLDGTVLIDDSHVSVWADRSGLLDSRVADLAVEVWPENGHDLWLGVHANVIGPAADGLKVLYDSPLSQYTGRVFAGSTVTGDMETDLALRLSLSDPGQPPDVHVLTRFSAVELDLEPGGLPLRGIGGILEYNTTSGFSSRDLAGTLWGEPVRATVSQRAPGAGPHPDSTAPAALIDLATAVEVSQLERWLGQDSQGRVLGRADLSVQLISAADEPVKLSIDSDLVGVQLDLPAPWAKAPAEQRPLHLDLHFDDERLLVDLDLAGGVAARLEFDDGSLRAAALAVNAEPAALQPGLVRVSGHTTYMDIAEWQRLFAAWPGVGREQVAAADTSSRLAFAMDRLQVDELRFGERNIGAAELGIEEEEGGWRVTALSDWLQGELRYRDAATSELDITYLNLAGLDALDPGSERGEAGEEDAAAVAGIVEVPPIMVTVEDLRHGETLIGNLAFELGSEGADIEARNISGQLASMQIRSGEPASLVWHQGPDGHTGVDATLHFQDLGQTLAQLGYEQVIVTREGTLQLALDWPGGPQDFSLASSRGSLRVDIGKGHFPDVSAGASGTLRVVSILNLAEIVQRLSLSHMFESGIPFNGVEGEVLFRAGTLEIPGIEVQGGASSFQFSGVSEVATRSLAGELVVTLPVANNLPWVAALTAGLPVAAGVFVLSKVFESQVNRLTSAVYLASGTWDDPQVTFDRVFDDTAPATEELEPPLARPAPSPPGPVPTQSGSP